MLKIVKKEKAVTLIALIITIIVLLILAGVTFSSLLGSNGLLNRASEAGDASKKAAENEENVLEHYAGEIDKWLSGGDDGINVVLSQQNISAGGGVVIVVTVDDSKFESIEGPTGTSYPNTLVAQLTEYEDNVKHTFTVTKIGGEIVEKEVTVHNKYVWLRKDGQMLNGGYTGIGSSTNLGVPAAITSANKFDFSNFSGVYFDGTLTASVARNEWGFCFIAYWSVGRGV